MDAFFRAQFVDLSLRKAAFFFDKAPDASAVHPATERDKCEEMWSGPFFLSLLDGEMGKACRFSRAGLADENDTVLLFQQFRKSNSDSSIRFFRCLLARIVIILIRFICIVFLVQFVGRFRIQF